MVHVVERIGRFTSSNIWKLCTIGSRPMTEEELKQWKIENPKSQKKNIEDGFGAPGLTYIQGKKAERCLGRSIDLGKGGSATIWGKVAEYYCDKFHLPLDCVMASTETDVHPEYPFWSGTKDFTKKDTAGEIKCFEPNKYFELSYALIKLNAGEITIDEFKKEFPDIYWQPVSNAIILNKRFAQIVCFMPTEEQLHQIRKEVEETNILEVLGIDPWKARFIIENDISELPYVKNPNYPNFVSYEWEIPQSEKDFLTSRVLKAEELINK